MAFQPNKTLYFTNKAETNNFSLLVWDGLHEQIGEERLGKRSPLMARLNGNANVTRSNGNGSGSGSNSASSTPSTGSPGDADDDVSKVSFKGKSIFYICV